MSAEIYRLELKPIPGGLVQRAMQWVQDSLTPGEGGSCDLCSAEVYRMLELLDCVATKSFQFCWCSPGVGLQVNAKEPLQVAQ